MLILSVILLLGLPLPGWSQDVPLFVIQRNKNANEVRYHLRVDAHCQLVSDAPVTAFWHLFHEDPKHTAPLTGLARLAYAPVAQTVTGNWVTFHLRPLPQRRLTATAYYQPDTHTCAPQVQVEIQGQWVALERIYVHADEGLLDPEVVYIDLFGYTLAAWPQPVTERIEP